MLEAGGGLNFPEEPIDGEGGGELGAKDLDRHPPMVALVLRQIDHGHPAPTDLAVEHVALSQNLLECVRG